MTITQRFVPLSAIARSDSATSPGIIGEYELRVDFLGNAENGCTQPGCMHTPACGSSRTSTAISTIAMC